MQHNQLISVAGYPFERGAQLGEKLRKEINLFLEKFCVHLSQLGIARETYMKKVSQFCHYIRAGWPNIHTELEGLSQGAKISLEEAYLLQVRREIVDTGPECSLYADYNQNNHIFIAQNIDLPLLMGDFTVLVKSKLLERNITILQVTQAGLLGYLGMNNYGISVGINMVQAPGWGIGIPVYLLVYLILQEKSLGDVEKQIKDTKRASSRALTITDGNKVTNVEMSSTEDRCMTGCPIWHANHYLHPYFHKYNNRNQGYRSYERVARLKDLTAEKKLTTDKIKALLSDHHSFPHSICAHQMGDNRCPRTVASVIMYPNQKRLNVAWGNPCKASYKEYSLEAAGEH